MDAMRGLQKVKVPSRQVQSLLLFTHEARDETCSVFLKLQKEKLHEFTLRLKKCALSFIADSAKRSVNPTQTLVETHVLDLYILENSYQDVSD